MTEFDFDFEDLEDEEGADEDCQSMTDEASAAAKCAGEATEAKCKKIVEAAENPEKKEVLSKEEQAVLKRMEDAIVKGNVTELEHAVGSVINNSQSLMRVVRALNSSLGSESNIHATASVTNTSDGGYTASVHIGLRHGLAKSSPYTAIDMSTNHTLGENGVTRPVASARYYRGGAQGSESIQPADALATMAQQLNRKLPSKK